MYTLESKGNFTIVVNDINLTILPNSKCQLSEDEFNSSLDIAKLKEYLTITKTDKIEEMEEILTVETNNEVNSIFVAGDIQEPLVGENVFVRQIEEDNINVEKQEESNIEVETANITEEVENVEVIETVETINEDSVVENVVEELSEKSMKSDEDKVTKQSTKSKEEKKQKGRPKKNK